MVKWASNTTRRYPGPFRGVTPIRSVRRPPSFTLREIARAIGWAVALGILGWAGTVLALSLGR